MKKSFPKTLIQIHYHNRPGGVTRVMQEYARTFSSINDGVVSKSIIICHSDRMFDSAEMKSVAGCDYRSFSSRIDYQAVVKSLTSQLKRILFDKNLPGPVCVAGHNLTLGKNCALSAAFAACVKFAQKKHPHHRFFSIVHDFAEEGRLANLHQINTLESLGIAIRKQFYLQSDNLVYVTPHQRNFQLLKSAGLNARCLYNPVNADQVLSLSADQKKNVFDTLAAKAMRDGNVFDRNKPTLFYPGRIIARKNCLEAILVACIAYRANLVLGPRGTSLADRALYRQLTSLTRKFKLPVVFDVSDHDSFLIKRLKNTGSVFNCMFAAAHCCITTSVAEGFGYALYEPWLHGTVVLGRCPMDFIPAVKMDCRYLYGSLNVPVQWVDRELLVQQYQLIEHAFNSISPVNDLMKRGVSLDQKFADKLILDFGKLDVQNQIAIVSRLITDSDLQKAWLNLNMSGLSTLPNGKTARAIIEFNRNGIVDKLGDQSFRRAFRRCFDSSPLSNKPSLLNYNYILAYFKQPDRLLPLLTPDL